jgi:hypothetical protein
MKQAPKPTDNYRFCNHHHEFTEEHQLVDFGTGPFVANKKAIPLLKALAELGLTTRTHHVDEDGGFFSILIEDHVHVDIKTVFERDADRTRFNGKTEIVIGWVRKETEQ